MYKLLFLLIAFIPTKIEQGKNKYVYKLKDCIGMGTSTGIIYKTSNVGVICNINAGNGFCIGKIEFKKEFKFYTNMFLYKVTPLIGNAYLKIGIDSTVKLRQRFSYNDTINIR